MHAAPKADIPAPAVAHHLDSAQGTTGSVDAQAGLIAIVGGSAIAMGDSTTATGLVENFAQEKGNVSIAMGEALFQAVAHAGALGDAHALATTFLDVSGADIVIERETGHTKHAAHDAWAMAELDYLAIDIHGWSPPQGPIVIDMHQAYHHNHGHHDHHGHGHHDHHGHGAGIEAWYGNFAHAFAAAETHGANGLSATFTDAITVANQFSFVSAIGLVAL